MKTLKLIIFVFISIALNGCEGKLDLTNPNKPTGETFWKTEADFRQAMASLLYTAKKLEWRILWNPWTDDSHFTCG